MDMKRTLATFLTLSTFLASQPLSVNALPLGARPAAARAQNLGEIAGTAVVESKPLGMITVRLRNVDNGRLVGDMRTNDRGEFRFTGLPVGNYVVETIAQNGTLLGTSTRISLAAGALVATGITVSTSKAAAGAGAAGAGAAGAGAATAVVTTSNSASTSAG